jgi:poly-gamma-glutamate synthesis protein (capsule biosynthesis protein)
MSVAAPSTEYHGTTLQSRPGISALHVRLVRRLSPKEFAALRRAAGAAYPTPATQDEARIGDVLFRKSNSPGLTWEMAQADETAVLASVHEARAKAGFVLFTIHAHQTAGDAGDGPAPYQPEVLHFANEAASPNDPRPADFEPVLFHAAIDAGADAVVRTGHGRVSGIRLYPVAIDRGSGAAAGYPFLAPPAQAL